MDFDNPPQDSSINIVPDCQIAQESSEEQKYIIVGYENPPEETSIKEVPDCQIATTSSEEQNYIIIGDENPPQETIKKKVPDLQTIKRISVEQKDIIMGSENLPQVTTLKKVPGLKTLKKSSKKHTTAKEKKNYLVDYEYDEKTDTYTCKTCQKLYKSKTSFISHKRVVCNVKPKYECIFCDYRGRSSSAVRQHIGHKHSRWPKLGNDGQWIY